MKPHKKYFLVAGLSLFLFVSGGIAFASSSQYLTQAQKFINQNCSKKKFADQTALLCYLFDKSQEQDASIASLSATLSPIPGQITALQNVPGKSLHVLDANNQDLGIYMSDNTANITTVFIPSLNRRATIVQNGLDRNALLYNSSDCTGTPYLYIANDDNHVNDIYSIAPGVYYEVKTGASPITLNSHSTYRYNQNTNQFECPGITQQISNAAYEAVQISLPFTEPIATPLQFRYQ